MFQGVGLVTIGIGVSMILESKNLIVSVVGILFGAVIGELIGLEKHLDSMASKLKRRLRFRSERFNEGFMTATVLFCVGSMAILGSIEDGLGQFPRLLYTKSLMDGISSVALSSTMGLGAIFSVIPMGIYQGLITLFAGSISGILSPTVVTEMTAVGGLMLLGIGFNVLKITKIPVINFLPGLFIAPLVAWLFL
ncbi:membrane protein [Bacteroidia bacterium]|nr:membrane protein [Bacteroidia bacterium]